VQDWDVFFIGGRWQPAAGPDRVEVISPASLKVVGRVPRATKDDGDRAVGAARAAFDTGPWPLRPASERLAILRALADAIEARTDQFADVLCAEQGLPRRGLPAGQISKAVTTLRAGADIGDDYPWTGTRPGTVGRTLRVRRVPVGVVVAIVPWNAPLFVAAMKLAPALAAGNTVVLKTPPETPLHTYLLAEAAIEAGLPEGVLSILPAGADISELLVRDPRVDKVSFTGSTAVGRQVGAICGADLKRCTLELGGKSAAVVLDDFQLTDFSARMLVTGAMVNAGQVCAAQTRILVPAARHDEIVDALSEATRALRVGDPASATTDIGPLISGRQRDRVERYIKIGVEEGASLVTGGGRPDIEPGWYVQPTLFAGVDNTMTIAREEIFGPVAAVIPYHDEAEAIALANDSEYGLAGAVWTADVGHGEEVAARIRTGSVSINSPGPLDAYGPFGGFKNSGYGREGGSEALDDYTECQTILLPAQANLGARTMSVLVLGSSGLVGRSLVGRLASAGNSVVACDVRPSPIPPVAGVSYGQTDVSRLDQVLALVEQHEVSGVVLLSYMMGQLMSPKYADILQACQTNITGVTNVLEAARLLRVPRVVFLSTVGTYGPQSMYGDRPVAEDEILAPGSMYGQMKALNESICDRYAALYDLEVVKIRPSSILGPGSSIWPARFLDRVALGETGLAPYGESARDNVVAVDDIAALLSRLVTGPTPAHPTYLASGHNVTMGELADAVRSIVPGAQIEFPDPKRRPTYPQTFDNSRAVTEFGWTITGLKETVRAHIDGVREQAGIPTAAA
jgi:aldehyde dehydrogenase (NAD+)